MTDKDRDIQAFVTALMQGEIPAEDLPDSFHDAGRPREQVLDDRLIEDAKIREATENVPDAQESAMIDVTYTDQARSRLGIGERHARIYAYLVNDEELVILDQDNELFGAFYNGHTEPGLGLSDVTDSIVESLSETVPDIELGVETREYGAATVRIHPTARQTDSPDIDTMLQEIAEHPDSDTVWKAANYRIWEAADHYVLGRVHEKRGEIEVERVANRQYDIDLGPLQNQVSVDIEHDYRNADLQNLPDALLDMAEDATQRGPLGLHCRDMGGTTILAQVDEQRRKIEVLDIGEYDIAFTDRAEKVIEKHYRGGARENGIKSALRNILHQPENNELAKRSHRTGRYAPPVGYASVDGDHRLYFAFNPDTEQACVLVAGSHDQLQDWYRADTGELVDEAEYLLKKNDLDPETYLGQH